MRTNLQRIWPVLLICTLTSPWALAADPAPQEVEVRKVALRDVEAMMPEKDVVLLDVRTPEEFAAGHVAGAININSRARDLGEQLDKLDKSKKYLVYCLAGVRSAAVADRMAQRGFTKLYEYPGGWKEYQKVGKNIEAGEKKSDEKNAAAVVAAAPAPAGHDAKPPAGHDGAAAMAPSVFTVADLKWAPGPASLPKGAQTAVLEGDPAKEGPFVFRVKVPDGYRVPPHTHTKVERVTVISGTFNLGMGKTFDDKAMRAMPAGTYGYWPAGMSHFVSATGETVLQFHGTGPWSITYVNPADDPRNAKP